MEIYSDIDYHINNPEVAEKIITSVVEKLNSTNIKASFSMNIYVPSIYKILIEW